jgi:hypothetical protein
LKPDKVLFIEVKGPKGRLSLVQEYRIAELRDSGFDVQVLTATP